MFTHLRILFSLLLIGSGLRTYGQTVFWSESFNNSCSSGCLAGSYSGANGGWTTSNEGSGDMPNVWYVSCAENGHTNNVCGSGCAASSGTATLASLHLGSTSLGDLGAAYDAGGLCGFFYCTNSIQRAISPLISTIGYSSITVSFDYIMFGQAGTDRCRVYYSTNSGSTWTLLVNLAQTTCCGGTCNGSRQGIWTTYSSTLPSACDNISTLKISFLWNNNDDGLGMDPSFAADNLKLSYIVPTPIDLLSFSADRRNQVVDVNWATVSETNNEYFSIERSADGVQFNPLERIEGAGNSTRLLNYSYTDFSPLYGVNYYRLKQTDFDGKFSYSKVAAVNFNGAATFGVKTVYYSFDDHAIVMSLISSDPSLFSIDLTDAMGRVIMSHQYSLGSVQNDIIIPLPIISRGMYLIKVSNGLSTQSAKMIF